MSTVPDNTPPPRAVMSWSSGKDSAFALHEAGRMGLAAVEGVVTTLNDSFGRVAMHGVRRDVLRAQIAALGLPATEVLLPFPCSNDVYEAKFGEALAEFRRQGIEHVVFGDLFLEDVRAYRERQLAEHGMTGIFPLWGRDTAALAREMIAAGIRAHLTCVDPNQLDGRFAGREYDRALLGEFPESVDPCGERGEFHTVVSAGPMFSRPLALDAGEVVTRDGFVFADFMLRDGN